MIGYIFGGDREGLRITDIHALVVGYPIGHLFESWDYQLERAKFAKVFEQFCLEIIEEELYKKSKSALS